MDKLLKIQGYLIAGAIGDSLGFIVEKKPFGQVTEFAHQLYLNKTYTIPFRTFPKNYLFGQYSDDTQFSRILIESILQNKEYKSLLIEEFIKGNLIGLGTNTKKVLNYYSKNTSSIPLEMVDNISNGSLMRTGVLGLIFNEPDLVQEVQKQSQITHNHHEVFKICHSYTLLVHHLLNHDEIDDKTIFSKLPSELALVVAEYQNKPLECFRQYLINQSHLAKSWEGVPPLAKETLMSVVLNFIQNKDEPFDKFITQMLKLGGDTDSTAALSGSLYGVYHGINSIPSHFRGIIHDQNQYKEDYFLALAQKIINFKNKLNE